MFKVSILLILLAVKISADHANEDPAAQQLPEFKNKTEVPIGILTTSYGSPIEANDIRTLNSNLIHSVYFMESAAKLVRERIPERVVHAIGAGAFGYFELTHDISHLCKAKFMNGVGKKTPVAVRFSVVGGEKGGVDTSRGPKGFAIKFYTEEGNFDLSALSTPIFVLKDPVFFPDLVHATRRNPVTNLPDVNMLWDFITSRPESAHSFLMTFGDRGIPDGFRRLPGYGIHTFQVVNQTGTLHFLRFHVLPDKGIKNLLPEEAQRIAGADPNYATRDLYNAIERGDYPSWTFSIQMLTIDDVKNAGFNVFDVTKELPVRKYPLYQVGQLVLNRNPNNYFSEIEQLAFNPGNLIPGIIGAPDKLFEGRRLMCRDAEIYRLGVNFNNIPVNCPMRAKSLNYLRDGEPPVNDNGRGAPNYYPNSFNGPIPYNDIKREELIQIIEDDSYNMDQVRELYTNGMSEEERSRVVENIVITLCRAIPAIQTRAINLFKSIHCDLGYRVYKRLQANVSLFL